MTNAEITPTFARRAPRRSLAALRITALLTLLSTAAQPVLAGMFLDNNVAALAIHEANAGYLHLIQLAQLIAAWLYWRPGGGRAWPLNATVVLWLLVSAQFAVGETANLTIHVPLGTLIVVLQLAFTVWAFSRSSRRPRPAA